MNRDKDDSISHAIEERGLTEPALLLLEAHRPLRPLLGLAATALLPIVRPLLGSRVRQIQRTLDDDAAYDAFVDDLRAGAGR